MGCQLPSVWTIPIGVMCIALLLRPPAVAMDVQSKTAGAIQAEDYNYGSICLVISCWNGFYLILFFIFKK
jgi:hypothetical protein